MSRSRVRIALLVTGAAVLCLGGVLAWRLLIFLNSTLIEIRNESGQLLTAVHLRVEDASSRGSFDRAIRDIPPSESLRIRMDSRDPLITLAYTRNGITSEYSDRTDLWTGETWTIIVRPDGSADGHYGELLESND